VLWGWLKWMRCSPSELVHEFALVAEAWVCIVFVGELHLVELSFCVAELKMSATLQRAVVCCGLRSMGAFDSVCIALMRSSTARCSVSPGSMAGILVCFEKKCRS
jgi:hypothetical protein